MKMIKNIYNQTKKQQKRTEKHISLIMLSSLYPKSKSRTALRYFRIYCYFFFFHHNGSVGSAGSRDC